MASVNPHTRELVFKLVFYGPGLGGKTTTLQYIHAATKPEHRGKMVSLATPTDRTLYFDFLPIRVPRVRGMAVRLQLFTVPGQVYYAATRKLVLSGADGVTFVADSTASRTDVNQESLDDLHANLAEHNRSLEEIPHTFHWNKRDLSDVLSLEELDRRFNHQHAPSLGTVATKGEGVFEGLERITRLVLKAYERDPKVRIEATNDPRSSGTAPGSEPRISEDGIAVALRQMETQGVEAPTKISQSLPNPHRNISDKPKRESDEPSNPAARRRTPGAWATRSALDPPMRDSSSQTPRSSCRTSSPTTSSLPQAPARPRSRSPISSPKAERDRVAASRSDASRRADAVNAILACDVLVTRVLASAAGLVGTLDAPRDPALVSLLLGLDGPRYLNFRTVVRAARHQRNRDDEGRARVLLVLDRRAPRAREALRR